MQRCMIGSFDERNIGCDMRYSAGLTRRIDYLQQHANEMFLFDDFLSRLRRDSLQILNASAGQTNMECCQLMQHSDICFVHDMLYGYQQKYTDIQTVYKTRFEDKYFLQDLHQWRNRLIEQYAMLDISDWWSQLICNTDSWRVMVRRLYETQSLIDCNASKLVMLIGNLGFMTSVLTGHGGEFGLDIDYSDFHSMNKVLQGVAPVMTSRESVVDNKEDLSTTGFEADERVIPKCFKFTNDYAKESVSRIVNSFYQGSYANLALIEVTLFHHQQLKKRNSHKAFVMSLVAWGMIEVTTEVEFIKIVRAVNDKYKRLPEEGYHEWNDNYKNERLSCERIGKRLGPTMPYQQ